MIPYDDLVAALASWRQRQGLPTGHIPTAIAAAAPPAAATPPAPAARPAPAPATRPATAPARSAAGGRPPAAVIVDTGHEDSVDVDDSAFLEEGGFDGDFAMSFSTDEPAESTAIGNPPQSSAPGAPPSRRGGR